MHPRQEILSHPILPTPPDLPSGDRNSTGATDASQRVSKPEVCPIFSKCYLDQSCAPDYHENGRQPGARRSETMDRLVKHHVTRQVSFRARTRSFSSNGHLVIDAQRFCADSVVSSHVVKPLTDSNSNLKSLIVIR